MVFVPPVSKHLAHVVETTRVELISARRRFAGGHTVYRVRLDGGAVVEVMGNGFGAPEGQTVRVRLSGQPIATVAP
jgi:hypothetical protein